MRKIILTEKQKEEIERKINEKRLRAKNWRAPKLKKKETRRQKKRSQRERQIARQKNLKPVEDFYSSNAWRELRYKVLRKFGFSCLACGRKPPSVILHVDHIKPRYHFPQLELSFDNLQVLCEDCNRGKGANYGDDFTSRRISNG